MYQFSFEKLEVWKDSRELVKSIYQFTNDLSEKEKFGLISQMRRSAISVSSNIAEGSSRTSKKDQAHFYQISFSSLMELLNQLILCFDLNFIDSKRYNTIREEIEKIANKLNALRKSRLHN